MVHERSAFSSHVQGQSPLRGTGHPRISEDKQHLGAPGALYSLGSPFHNVPDNWAPLFAGTRLGKQHSLIHHLRGSLFLLSTVGPLGLLFSKIQHLCNHWALTLCPALHTLYLNYHSLRRGWISIPISTWGNGGLHSFDPFLATLLVTWILRWYFILGML